MAFAQDASGNNSVDYPAASAPANNTASDRVVLDPGTVIPVLLNTELSSKTANAGDTFTAKVDTNRSAYNSLLRGAEVEGVVRHVSPQSGSDPGTLDLTFTRLRLLGGESYLIFGTVTSLDSKDLQVKSDGTLQAVKTNKDQSLTYAGIGAGAGALINVLGGGKLRIEDLLLGGGLGYAAGQLLKGTQKVSDVDLKPGTPVGVLLNQRVSYHRTYVPTAAPVAPAAPAATAAPVVPAATAAPVVPAATAAPVVLAGSLRVPVRAVRSSRSTADSGRRYYSYLGHPYYLDLKTGKRVRLD